MGILDALKKRSVNTSDGHTAAPFKTANEYGSPIKASGGSVAYNKTSSYAKPKGKSLLDKNFGDYGLGRKSGAVKGSSGSGIAKRVLNDNYQKAASADYRGAAKKVKSGYMKFEKGKSQVGKLLGDLGTLMPGESSGGRRSRSSRNADLDFINSLGSTKGGFGSGGRSSRRSSSGLSDNDLDDLMGLNGTIFGSSKRSSGRKRSGSKKGLVPIYRGKRIVGYTQSKRRKSKAKNDPFDFGF